MTSFVQGVLGFFKWKAVRWTLIGFAVLVVAAIGVLYAGSEWQLARTYDVAPIALNAPSPSAENGARLATLIGCKACHKESGGVLISVPVVAVLPTPNLTRVAQEYSDAELVRVLRKGVKRDGTSAMAMPTESFAWLADDDVADIIAWMRSLKPVPDARPAKASWGPIGRLMLLQGTAPISAQEGKDAAPPVARPTGPAPVVGNYLAHIACLHCHKLNVEHEVKPGTIAPPLRPMAQSYDLAQFRHLLRTGKAIGDRDVGMMSEVAKESFSFFSDNEVAAIHAYLMQTDGQAGTP